MFYLIDPIGAVVIIIALVTVVIVWLFKSLGGMQSSSLPKGVVRLKLDRLHERNSLIRILYAWHLTDNDKYIAYVECRYTKDHERIETKSKEELEDRIDEVIALFSKHIKEKDRKY